jgi:hypothetical protein
MEELKNAGLVSFELSEDDEAVLSEAFSGRNIAEYLHIDWDEVESLSIEISETHLIGLSDLEELNMLVTGVSVGPGPDQHVYLNMIANTDWPEELALKEPRVRSLRIGYVEGPQTPAIVNSTKTLTKVLEFLIFTFFREEDDEEV